MKRTFCGYVAVVGRPNVGKSTLLNALIDKPVSITSAKPQTTRHNILGVHTRDPYQYIFLDTPGLHRGQSNRLNRFMNRQAMFALRDVDCLLWVVDTLALNDDDRWVLAKLKHAKCPVILVLNKIDLLKDKCKLLPIIEALRQEHDFREIIPISAKQGHNLSVLMDSLRQYLPEGVFLFYSEQYTDRPTNFLLAEFIREQLFRHLEQELPYGIAVYIEKLTHRDQISEIHALILVNSPSHKPIVIGKAGTKLKMVGQAARARIEHFLGKKVLLKLWVKTKVGWLDNEQILKQYGYDD